MVLVYIMYTTRFVAHDYQKYFHMFVYENIGFANYVIFSVIQLMLILVLQN